MWGWLFDPTAYHKEIIFLPFFISNFSVLSNESLYLLFENRFYVCDYEKISCKKKSICKSLSSPRSYNGTHSICSKTQNLSLVVFKCLTLCLYFDGQSLINCFSGAMEIISSFNKFNLKSFCVIIKTQITVNINTHRKIFRLLVF